MSGFVVQGGKKLHGKIKTNATKNSTVAILCATPMIRGRVVLDNVPVIEEVKRIIEILQSLGLKITWLNEHRLEIINTGQLDLQHINQEAFCLTRSALLLMGSLSSVFDNFKLPKAGGCHLGLRTVSPYLIALEHLNIKVQAKTHSFLINSRHKKATDLTMYEMGDTATENTILAAVLTPGTTTIHFASANYMVQDLCYFLKSAGAKIVGIGTSTLVITGVKKLKPTTYAIMPDPIESMAFIALAIVTKSKLTITHCPIDFLRLELEKLRVMGQAMIIGQIYKSDNKHFDLVDITIKPSTLKALPDKLHPQPYPGLNIDNLPLFIPILTQAKGATLVNDWVYEGRAIHYAKMKKFGAQIITHDQHRLTVIGPTKLKAANIFSPPALRPAINLLICMLGAKGQSTLHNTYPIERGYENLVGRLSQLGATIKKI